MNVELIYDADCPNVAATRSLLIKAFAETGVSARWREWERGTQESPAHVHGFGSPTILVNGKDIVDANPSNTAASCRVYSDDNGRFVRTPPFELICSALRKGASIHTTAITKGRWQTMMASFPAIGTALLPKLVCPLCLPAYTALLGALGLGFVDYTPYLLPLTVIFLALAIGVLVIQTRRSGRWLPLMMGLAAAAVIMIGKFLADLTWLTAAGIALLIVAIVMTMRKKITPSSPCPACASAGGTPQSEAH